jgi:hypothetical protein
VFFLKLCDRLFRKMTKISFNGEKNVIVPVLTSYKKLENKYDRLRLDKTLTVEARNRQIYSIRTDWGQKGLGFLTFSLFYPTRSIWLE